MMSDSTAVPPLTSRAYRSPVSFAAAGAVALLISTSVFPLYRMLAQNPVSGDPSWFPLAGAAFGGGFWFVVAIGGFAYVWKKARAVLQQPQDSFQYSSVVTWLLILAASALIARNVWMVFAAPTGFWTSWDGALMTMYMAIQMLIVSWCLCTAWLRTNDSGFAGPATVAAIAFLVLGFWPLALVILAVYLKVRKNEGPVPDAE